MTKKEKQIIQEDIKDLLFLIDKYTKEKKFAKASECLRELREFETKLKNGDVKNEK